MLQAWSLTLWRWTNFHQHQLFFGLFSNALTDNLQDEGSLICVYVFHVQLTQQFGNGLVITIPRKSSVQDMKQGVRCT